MSDIHDSRLLRYGVVVLIVAIALVLMLSLDPWLGMSKTPFLLFFSAVVVSAWYGGLKSGILASFLSAVFSDYFFLVPAYSLNLDLSNVVRVGLFVGQGLLLSLLFETLRAAKLSTEANLQQQNGNISEPNQVKLENIKLHQKLQQAIQQKDESLALLDAWLTSSPVGLAFLDTELRYVYANEALANTNGVPQSQHIGRTLREVLPQWAPEIEPIFEHLMQTKQPLLNQEVSGETYPAGVYRYGLVSYYPVCLPDGKLLGVGIASIDITQLKQTEAKLRESEAKFRSVVDSNMIGIGFWEKDGRITDANDALLLMLGYTREELFARKLNWQNLTPKEYLPLDEQALNQLKNSFFCTPYEKEYIRKDGSRLPILLGGSCLKGTVDQGAFFILDITERKQAEEIFRCIAEISNQFSTSLDYEQTLEQIAKILVPQLADWCCIDILQEDGSIRRLPIAHADASKAEWARQLQQYPSDPQGTNAIALVLQTGQSKLILEVSDSQLEEITQNYEQLKIIQQLGIKSLIIVPLATRGRVLGCIQLVIAQGDRRYNQCDLALAKDIASRVALAVENTQLYQDIHQAVVHYAESLSLLDALLAAAPVAVCFLDRELRYIRINQVLADINGLSIEEHLGRKFREVLPEMALELEPQLQRVLDTGKPLLNVEIHGDTRGQPGRYGYWLGNYYPVYNALNETVGVGIILAEVTATKLAEIALRENEAKFRAMFDQAAVGIAQVALDGQFMQINAALCEITGYSYAELMQMNFRDITHPDDLANDWAQGQRVLAREINGYSLEKRYIRKDGGIIWVNLTASVVWDANGQPKYAVGIIEDISDRKRAEAAQQFLVETSAVLAASLDYKITLTSVANLAVPTLADWCIVDIFREDSSIQQIAIATADPAQRNMLRHLRWRDPSPNAQLHPFLQKLRQGQSIFYPEFSDSILEDISQEAKYLQQLRGLGILSLMVIPLRSRGQVFGAISFVTAESGRHYEQADLALAEDVARRAAVAIDNARLYYETQQAKQAAEQAVNRTVLLQKITAALSEALTPQQVAEVVVKQGIAALGAKAGSVVLLDNQGTSLKLVQAVGYSQSLIDAWTNFPLTASGPSAETVLTGKPIFTENRQAWIEKYPHLADIIPQDGHFAHACIPLIQQGKTIGALGFNFATVQTFNEKDQRFMLTLGQQCGQAIARAQLYEAEQTARTQAETANRIKDEFLAILSHELRTPLNPILGWSKLLRTRNFDEAARVMALETIERNAKLQTQLIDDLLDVSRILRGKLRLNIGSVNLITTIAAALETVRLAAEAKSIQIHTVLANDIGQVIGDGDRLQQVIWNLLSNAVKFTPPKGRIEVKLSVVSGQWSVVSGQQQPTTDNQQLTTDKYAQIQVIDTGKGISPEFLPHVFDYFRQADAKTTRVFGGLGLGLAIVRHLVELHGGIVQAESLGEGKGATFTVKLPLLKSAESRMQSAESAEEVLISESILSGVQILLVDDQSDIREFFSFALEQYGATVTAVASASEALVVLAQSHPDVLLSDIGMPEMDGYMLLREVRTWPPEQSGQIPAIALTAYAAEIDYNRALEAGFQKHVPKPADPVELAKAIANLIGRNY
ncbi:two-component hybrid sensor and regulator [Nostoc sp. NIES-4103]|nr:two-component hybrid sensor and regulator [Nostoc sp. NIES-4103]